MCTDSLDVRRDAVGEWGEEEPGDFMAKGGIQELTLRTCTAGDVVLSWNSDKIELYTDSECQNALPEDEGSVAGSRQATLSPVDAEWDIWDARYRKQVLWAKAVELSDAGRDIHMTVQDEYHEVAPDAVNLSISRVEFGPDENQNWGYDKYEEIVVKDHNTKPGDPEQTIQPPPEMDLVSLSSQWMTEEAVTTVTVTVQGADPNDVLFVSSDRAVVRPGEPRPNSSPYILKIKAVEQDYGTQWDALLEARLGGPEGPLARQLGVKVYDRKVPEDPYVLWKIYDAGNEGATTPAYRDDIKSDTVQESTNEYIKACVIQLEVEDGGGGGLVHVPYDRTPKNGTLDIYFDGSPDRGQEYFEIFEECRPLDKAVLYVRDVRENKALLEDAEEGDPEITVAGGGHLCLGRDYTIWRQGPDYSVMYFETVRFSSRDPDIPGKLKIQGDGLANAYPKETSFVILTLAGLCMYDRGVYVASSFSGSTLEHVKWVFAHEIMHHAGGLLDIEEVNNLMGDWPGTNLRFRQLRRFYEPEQSESQWDKIGR